MKNRLKTQPARIKTRAEMNALVGEIARLSRARNQLILELDEALAALREKYATTLAGTEQTIAEKTAQVRAWAEANPGEFKGLRSLELNHGVIGWRVGQPALKPMNDWSWDRVLARLKSLPEMFGYIRSKEEVNKQSLLADRGKLGHEALRSIGVQVAQEENFYVDPRGVATGARQWAVAA